MTLCTALWNLELPQVWKTLYTQRPFFSDTRLDISISSHRSFCFNIKSITMFKTFPSMIFLLFVYFERMLIDINNLLFAALGHQKACYLLMINAKSTLALTLENSLNVIYILCMYQFKMFTRNLFACTKQMLICHMQQCLKCSITEEDNNKLL